MTRERDSDGLYTIRFSEDDRRAKAAVWKEIAAWFTRHYVPEDATVVDLGAGNCELINQIRARRRIAVDISSSLEGDAREGVEALRAPLDELSSHLDPGSIDLAFASNVFEHLRSPEMLTDVLRQVWTVLRPGGRLIVMQPNVRLVGGRFWDFLDHTLP
ncbi:MAG: methyltransferase, partial [Thermoanaerobaculia bacterium]|nr:methyltransferase [Thermoanaerobaculia bacterium]